MDLNKRDLICFALVETWLNANMPNHLVSIKGYNIARQARSATKRGGGILLYIREDLSWDLAEPMYNVSNKNIELLSIIIHRKCTRPICISTMHLPPAGSMNDALKHLHHFADFFLQRILTGYLVEMLT